MRLTEIEVTANRGRLATGDFRLAQTLRFEVLPEFYRKIGDATWLRKNATAALLQDTQTVNLPDDFRSMVAAYLPASAGGLPPEMKYIGEDPLLVAAAETATEPASPRGFYIVPRSTDRRFRAMKVTSPADQNYTIPYVYRSRLVCPDSEYDVELDEFIPEEGQQALIAGLRREIMLDRFGQGDARFLEYKEKFLEIVEELKEGTHDLARRNYAVYVD